VLVKGGKVKVNLPLCFLLTEHHVTKPVQLHVFLTSAVDGCERQLHAPTALPLGKEPPVLIS